MRRLLAGVLCAALWWGPLQAQEWPSRTRDDHRAVHRRLDARQPGAHRGRAPAREARQPFVVENRAGASGNTGTAAVAKAAPDGHTLGVSIVGPLVINALLFAKMPYDTAKDIAPITILASQPSVLVVNPSRRRRQRRRACWRCIKREPDKFTYGSIGRGSLSHLAMASLALKAGRQAWCICRSRARRLPSRRCCAATCRWPCCRPASVAPQLGRRQAQAAGRDLAAALAAAARSADPAARLASPASRPTRGSA